MTNTNPSRTSDMNPDTARRVNRYTYTSLMKKNQKKSSIFSLDGSSLLYMSNIFTEIMILLSVPSYTVKQNYDAVNSIMWLFNENGIQWVNLTFSLKWYTSWQVNICNANGTAWQVKFSLNIIHIITRYIFHLKWYTAW
jgi:hypothetical protein